MEELKNVVVEKEVTNNKVNKVSAKKQLQKQKQIALLNYQLIVFLKVLMKKQTDF